MNKSIQTHILAGILILLFASLLYWKSTSGKKGSTPSVQTPDSEKQKAPPIRTPDVPEKKEDPHEEKSDRGELRNWIEQFGRATILRDKRTYNILKQKAPTLKRSDLTFLFGLLSDPLFLSAGTAELLKSYRLPESIDPLVKMIHGKAYLSAKAVGIEAIASVGGDAAVHALIRLLSQHSDTGVRSRVATALSRFKTPEAHRELVKALRSESNAIVRRYIAKALRRLPSQEMVEILLATLPNEPDSEVLADIAIATYQSGGESVLPRIREIIDRRPEAKSQLQNWFKLQQASWYDTDYSADFFQSGKVPLPFYPRFKKIGITVDTGSNPFPGALAPIFLTSPLDRYRDFFYFRLEKEWVEDLATGTKTPRAYDIDGRPIPGGVESNPLDGTVHLRFLSPKEFSPGILGFTEGKQAAVTATSLLHEFGHALAKLADEYDHDRASDADGANIDTAVETPKWTPLIEQGHLGTPVPRRDMVIPSRNCHMNNQPNDDRWCPVCQLALIAKICELSGASAPW